MADNILKRHDVGFFSVFRADQGRFLDYIVSWGNLTEERVALYLRDILEALHYLHSWRIAHLDLKVGADY